MIFLTTLLISLFLTIILIPIFSEVAVRLNTLDVPNERKVHARPIPKSGGIAMVLGVLVPVAFWAPEGEFLRAVMVGTGIVVLFGLIDDVKDLGYGGKFIGQIVAALVVIFYGGLTIADLGLMLPAGVALPGWLSVPLTLVVIVGVTNAVNLADGLDGLAGGICLLCFACLAFLAYLSDNFLVALVAVAVVGAIFGFLRFNTYPASLFMGDTGSQFLGFLAITLSLGLTQTNAPLSSVVPLLLVGFPVLDTLYVMTARVAAGVSPFTADKNHFHHKLLRHGFFHTEAVMIIYVIQAALVTAAFLFRFSSEWFLLGLYLVVSGSILAAFSVAGRAQWRVQRYDFIDLVVKGHLRRLRGKKLPIRVSFRAVSYGLPALLVFTCLLPAAVPEYLSAVVLGFVGLLLAAWAVKKEWLGGALRICLYFSIPFIVYLSRAEMAGWMGSTATRVYDLCFVLLVVFVMTTLKFTRRRKGFKPTPMDALILFVALVVPNLPDAQIRSYHLGLVAAQIITFFFSYEVLMGELRGEYEKLGAWTLVAMVVVAVRGLVL